MSFLSLLWNDFCVYRYFYLSQTLKKYGFIYLLSFVVFWLLPTILNSQILQILDSSTGEPIEGVALFNYSRTKLAISDKNGIVKIENFESKDTIYFQHPSYHREIFTMKELELMSHRIFLRKYIRMLEEFVFSTHKWEQKKSEIPNKIESISSEEIHFYNPQTAADMLGSSNNVFIQKSQMGGGSPMIRGFSANSVLLVIDGVRMNNAICRSGNLHNVISIDPNIIENSEIIFGPGSVVYGSDALGGVMDFHTKRPVLSTGIKFSISANALARYSSANNEKTGHFDFNLGWDKWAYLASITYSDFGDLRMGASGNTEYKRLEYASYIEGKDTIIANENPNIQRFTGYNQLSLMQKLRFRPNEYFDISYTYIFSKLSDVPRYDRLIEYSKGNLKYGEWYYGPQNWTMHTLNTRYDKSCGIFDETKVVLAFQEYEESRHDRKFGKTELRNRTENVNAFSVNADLDKEINKNATVYYGLEAIYNNVKSTAHQKDIKFSIITPASTRYPDGTNHYLAFAAYTIYKVNLFENLTLNTGIRYNYVSLRSTLFDTSYYNFPFDQINLNTGAINGSLGIVYRPNEKWQVKLNFSTGFRAPNLDDVAKIFDSEPGNVVVPNKELHSEYAFNLDLGIVKQVEDVLYFELTGFYTILKDAMVRREFLFNGMDSIIYDGELSKVYAVVNASRAFIYGGSFSFETNVTRLISFKTNLTYTRGEDQDGIPLRHIPPLFGSAGVQLHTEKLETEFYFLFNGERPNKLLAPSEQSKTHMYAKDKNGNPFSPSWYTLNLKISYQLNSKSNLNAGIENILNHRYRPYSSGIVAPGRNLIFALGITL
jgi:hemoglobin/transferrin/lactoferrin receptor protein